MKLSCWISGTLKRHAVGIPGCSFSGFRKALFGVFTCIFALVGIITGSLKGQTTETGFVRGAGIGAVTGAVTAVQLLELIISGESLSKLGGWEGLHGMGWPAVIKAYQWQVSSLETSYMEISDIYDADDCARGLPQSLVERIPVLIFDDPCYNVGVGTCSICLQESEGGERGKRLPDCSHVFHLGCLDSWLIRRGSCPMCRGTSFANATRPVPFATWNIAREEDEINQYSVILCDQCYGSMGFVHLNGPKSRHMIPSSYYSDVPKPITKHGPLTTT